MNIVFRADASLEIGTGHVMRCLTLANALASQGNHCHFICREHPGNLIDLIQSRGYPVSTLPLGSKLDLHTKSAPAHAQWLRASQQEDAQACVAIMSMQQVDWMVVDHYALDSSWEATLRPYCRKLMVIDDLADRSHLCDLLLDQTFGRRIEDYNTLLPFDSQILCGSRYALLRPEFTALRTYSLNRRKTIQLKKLLITMGGVDKDNVAGQILQALRFCRLPEDYSITVVMGSTAPWLKDVQQLADTMPWSTEVLVGVSNMAQLMADSDLAIGAAGATTWERCCLGLPTIMLVLADNQQLIAKGLEQAGAAFLIEQTQAINSDLPSLIMSLNTSLEQLAQMGKVAASIVDGLGVDAVLNALEN